MFSYQLRSRMLARLLVAAQLADVSLAVMIGSTVNAHIAIGSIATALSLVLALFFVSVVRVPGWRHYRTFSLVALASSAYAALAIWGEYTDGTHWQSKTAGSLSLVIAFGTPLLWLRFDSKQEARSLERSEHVVRYVLMVGMLLCFVPGLMTSDWQEVPGLWFGVTTRIPETTAMANVFISIMLIAMAQLVVRYAHRAWTSGGSWIRFASCLMFGAGIVEEGLVATDVLDWPFLGPIAYTSSLLLMALDLGDRVARNANRLESLNDELEDRIAKRTEELVVAREVLLSTERKAALGQLAAGVGHEVNNPLSYVKGNLDYLQDQIHASPARKTHGDALAAIGDALHGAEKIRCVVDNLATYARSAPITGAAHIHSAVDVAMRVVRPQSKFAMDIDVQLDPVPPVAIDESKLIQVLVNLLLNSAQASRGIEPTPSTIISARRGNQQAVIEIIDQGCGMTDPSTLLEPPLQRSHRETDTGLGLFLSRSLIETAGGSLLIESSLGDGMTVRIALNYSKQSIPSLSDSMTKPSTRLDA